jgi:hypothetical protein
MRCVIRSAVFSALLAAAVFAGPPVAARASLPAHAGGHDGSWSVLIITEKGDCDRAYHYAFKIEHGQVSYAGDSSVDMSGSVSASGAVRVSIKLGDTGASGTGHLRGQSGAGVWRGVGSGNSCAGRWEAERQ